MEPSARPQRLAELVGWLATLALVLVLPLVWSAGSLSIFRGPQTELALALWGLLAALFVAANATHRPAWTDPWWLPWAAVAVAGAASAVLADQPVRTLVGLVPVGLAGLGWGTIRQLPERRRLQLVRVVVAAGVLEAVATLAFLSRELRPESFALLATTAGRFEWIGTLGNPGYVATFLVLPALLAAALALRSTGSGRIVAGAAALLMVTVVVGTETVTAIAALGVGAAVLFWRRLPPRRRLVAVAVAALAAAAVVVATPMARKIDYTLTRIGQGRWMELGTWRGAAYAAAGRMIAAHPLTGVGLNLFESHSFAYQDEDTLAERARQLGLDTGFGEAHNDVLQWAAETGAMGVVLVIAALLAAWRRRPPGAGALPARAPLVAAAAVLAATQFPFHLAAIAAQWIVVAALAVPSLPPPTAARRRSDWLRLGAALLAAAVIAGVGWQRHEAQRALQQGRILSENLRGRARPEARIALAQRALAAVEARLRWLPYSWQGRLVAGNLAMDAGRPTTAAREFRAAVALSDRPELRYNLGMALLAAGDRSEGMDELVAAVTMNPALLRQVEDRDLAVELRARLDASGYAARHPWIYANTAAD